MITQNQHMLAEHTVYLGLPICCLETVSKWKIGTLNSVSFISPEHYSCHVTSLLIQVSYKVKILY